MSVHVTSNTVTITGRPRGASANSHTTADLVFSADPAGSDIVIVTGDLPIEIRRGDLPAAIAGLKQIAGVE